MGGRVHIYYEDDVGRKVYLDLGSITSISDAVTKQTGITPIVSKGMRNSFPVENGNSQTINVSFTRHDPGTTEYDTSNSTSLETTRKWSNAKWYKEVSAAIDRWQMRSNGCELTYTPNEDGDSWPGFTIGGYIKSITRLYRNDYNEVITGTLRLTVGTMYVNDADLTGGVSYENMNIIISDKSVGRWFVLNAGTTYNCVNSVEISAGPECPFEVATIKVPKKKLMEFAPELENSIVASKNRLSMDMFGNHDMILEEVRNGDTITITAYCAAYAYTGATMLGKYDGSPWDIIKNILTSGSYGPKFDTDHIHYRFLRAFDVVELSIPSNTNIWRLLQICATMLRCKIFFADDCAYILDYTLPTDIASDLLKEDSVSFKDITGGINLFDKTDATLGERCIGDVDIDEEGTYPLANTMTLSCNSSGSSTMTTFTYVDKSGSVESFGEKAAGSGTIQLPELVETLDDTITGLLDGETPSGAENVQEGEYYVTSLDYHAPEGDVYVSVNRWTEFTSKESRAVWNNVVDEIKLELAYNCAVIQLEAVSDGADLKWTYKAHGMIRPLANGPFYALISITVSGTLFIHDTFKYLIEGTGEGGAEDVIVSQYMQGSTFASNYLTYRREPQRSVTFTVKEMYHPNGARGGLWKPVFDPFTRVWWFKDHISGEKVTNDSEIDGVPEGTVAPQKLAISSYTRTYPKGICEYSFGKISNKDLASSLSQLNNAVGSR